MFAEIGGRMTTFEIAELPLGQAMLGLCPLPGRQGDLAADVATLKAWGAALVVTLVQHSELTALGVAALPDLLGVQGIAWRHFPIVDFDVPAEAAQGEWAALAAEILGLVGQGQRVVLHCRGGCGRTGMAALRLMVMSGEEPGAALARLRGVRPCAVETEAQQNWASASGAFQH
jgi:protein-tyrosine phosphatase